MHLLVSNQLFTRVVTFVVNIVVARLVGPAIFGLQGVNMYLIYVVVLSLSREGIRRSTLRHATADSSTETPRSPSVQLLRIDLINLAWFQFPLSVLLAAMSYWLMSLSPPTSISEMGLDHAYSVSLRLFTLSALVELTTESLYVFSQRLLMVKLRVGIESLGVLARAIITCVWATMSSSSYDHLLSFAYGQMAYSLVVTVAYHLYFGRHLLFGSGSTKKSDDSLHYFMHWNEFFPLPRPSTPTSKSQSLSPSSFERWLDVGLLRLTLGFTANAVMKFILTEGEKIVMVSFDVNLDKQGVYALVNNLGSLVARILFQPLEESSFMEFSMLLKSQGQVEVQSAHSSSSSSSASSSASSALQLSNIDSAARTFTGLFKLVSLVGLIFVSFGPNYSYLFFDLLYGGKWSATDAPMVLSWYCLYIFIMAMNGQGEALMFAAMTHTEITWYNGPLMLFSGVYVLGCILALSFHFGPVGLIWANCANMLLRVAYTLPFIRRFFVRSQSRVFDLASIFPNKLVLSALAASHLMTALSFAWLGIASSHSVVRFGLHIAVGCLCLAGVAGSVWLSERAFLGHLRSIWRKRRS